MYFPSFLYNWSLCNQTRCADVLLTITKPSTRKWVYTDSSTSTYSITWHHRTQVGIGGGGGGGFAMQGDKPCYSLCAFFCSPALPLCLCSFVWGNVRTLVYLSVYPSVCLSVTHSNESPSVENPVLSTVLPLKSGVHQNTAMLVSPTARNICPNCYVPSTWNFLFFKTFPSFSCIFVAKTGHCLRQLLQVPMLIACVI